MRIRSKANKTRRKGEKSNRTVGKTGTNIVENLKKSK